MTSKTSKRLRCGNFSADEKELIVGFVRENASVLESKLSEPNLFKKKRKLWETLSEKMRSAGYIRSPTKLRDTYFRMKQSSKSRVTKYNREKKKTGGGEGPTGDDCPSELDWAIYDTCPVDFEEDVSEFDSDFFKRPSTSTSVPSTSTSVPPPPIVSKSPTFSFEGLIDPVTGEIEREEVDFLNPVLSCPPPSASAEHSGKNKKRKREMSAYEEMLNLNKNHIEARIANERAIHEKELEILEIKKQSELLRHKILLKMLNSERDIDIGKI